MMAAIEKATIPLRLIFRHVRLKRYCWNRLTARKNRDTLTNQRRYGSIATAKPATPIAALKLNGRQHASVDRAVTVAATGITLVAGFIVWISQQEQRYESIHVAAYLQTGHPRSMFGNSPHRMETG